jgi:hypothetical protein
MKTITRHIVLYALTILLLVSAGCKTYMHFKYGLAQPGEETPEKLLSFLEKHHFPVGGQQVFSDSGTYCQAMRNPLFSKYILSHMIFDREGILLRRDTTQCQWSGYDRVKTLRIDSNYATSGDLKLNQVLCLIRPLSNDTLAFDSLIHPDFTVIVTWARFIGSYNSRLFVLSEAVKQNRTARIRMLWLNVDMQESWKLRPGQKVYIR